MAYRIGIANGYLDMLLMLKRFVESEMQVDSIAYDGGNTGDGYISAEGASDASGVVADTWTINVLEDSGGIYFTVTGASYGLQSATGVVGTEYSTDSDELVFTLVNGNTAWADGDEIVVTTAEGLGNDKWTVNEYDDSDVDGSPEKQLQIQGVGTGLDEIFVGIQTYSTPASSIYGWKLAGFTGYNPASTFASQPGKHSGFPYTLFEDREMPYWIVANSRRILMCYEVNGVYEWVHLGFLLPYGLPNENPYPLLIGGSSGINTITITSQSYRHTAFWNHGADSVISIESAGKVWDGSWFPIINKYGSSEYDQYGSYDIYRTWPYSIGHGGSTSSETYQQQFAQSLRANYDGSYPLFPVIIWKQRNTKRTIGQVQGLYYIPGDNVNAGDLITISGVDYYVLPNTHKITNAHWAALKME